MGRIIRANYTRLPPELEPYQARPLHISAPPTKGTWRAGQRVLAHPLVSADGSGWEPSLGTAAGWVCTTTGTPGRWAEMTLPASISA